MTLLELFTDPVLRAPTMGSILMGVAAALVGVIAFVQRRSLLGETLSHACYPGVVLAVALTASMTSGVRAGGALAAAAATAALGLWLVNQLVHRVGMRQDTALCLVLAGLFGIGVTVASRVQFVHAAAFRQIEGVLYGQAATMTDASIALYAGLALLTIGVVLLFYKELQVCSFDPTFATTCGIRVGLVEGVTLALLVLAVVLGMRTVGVVLMSAMLVAPPAAARQFTNRLSVLFVLAALFGGLSGFLGNASVMWLGSRGSSSAFSLPTGPMIVLVTSSLCFLSLLFAPARGVLLRKWRVRAFRHRCLTENILKAMWRVDETGEIPFAVLSASQSVSRRYLRFVLRRLEAGGWVEAMGFDSVALTSAGRRRAGHIVRLHRLWELYLSEQLGIQRERVHHSAEEMEHILTPEMEHRLTELLDDPTHDPHAQPIPPRDVTA